MIPAPRNLGLTLDAGVLIEFDRGNQRVRSLLNEAHERSWSLAVPAGVLAQVWRNGARQARVARLLATPTLVIVPLDEHVARTAGELCGHTKTSDVVDASVVLCARQRSHAVVTSDPGDLRHLDPNIALISV